jgi:hypothetical protein
MPEPLSGEIDSSQEGGAADSSPNEGGFVWFGMRGDGETVKLEPQ